MRDSLEFEHYPHLRNEATLNPSNPRDRATDWETDVVNDFRNGRARDELINTRDPSTTGTSLFLARPIKVTNVSCLECHSTPDKAPPAMIRLYGPDNGFGWKMDEIIGAQFVLKRSASRRKNRSKRRADEQTSSQFSLIDSSRSSIRSLPR
jgi:hypothetical protein